VANKRLRALISSDGYTTLQRAFPLLTSWRLEGLTARQSVMLGVLCPGRHKKHLSNDLTPQTIDATRIFTAQERVLAKICIHHCPQTNSLAPNAEAVVFGVLTGQEDVAELGLEESCDMCRLDDYWRVGQHRRMCGSDSSCFLCPSEPFSFNENVNQDGLVSACREKGAEGGMAIWMTFWGRLTTQCCRRGHFVISLPLFLFEDDEEGSTRELGWFNSA